MDLLDLPPALLGPMELPWPDMFDWLSFSADDGKKRAINAELQCTFSVHWKKGQNMLSVRGPPEHLHRALQRAMELMRPDLHQQALAGGRFNPSSCGRAAGILFARHASELADASSNGIRGTSSRVANSSSVASSST